MRSLNGPVSSPAGPPDILSVGMAVGLGFVSICLSERDCSPAGNVSVARASRVADPDARVDLIRRTARRNLENTLRILWFLHGQRLQLYRFATHLIPLATHPLTDGWAWWEDGELRPLLQRIGEVVRQLSLRVSTHPPQLCVLNSKAGWRWALAYGQYHCRLLEAMGLDSSAKIVLHPGRALSDARTSVASVARAVERLPESLRARLALENDDGVFSAAMTLAVCRTAGLPMVFDWHHHVVRNDGEDWRPLLSDAFATWKDRPPKVHVSSPRDDHRRAAHADYVDPGFVGGFLRHAASLGDVDVMVEAKAKDLAALRLRADFPEVFVLADRHAPPPVRRSPPP